MRDEPAPLVELGVGPTLRLELAGEVEILDGALEIVPPAGPDSRLLCRIELVVSVHVPEATAAPAGR